MDLYCPRCAEPMDVDSLHDTDYSFPEARNLFFSRGCGVLFNGTPCPQIDSEVADASAAMLDLLGDDVDGIAAMMDDLFQ